MNGKEAKERTVVDQATSRRSEDAVRRAGPGGGTTMNAEDTKTAEDCSLYDSGRTDSGFLSGANILSGENLSGEITPPYQPSDGGRPKYYTRLDSGVDVGLTDRLGQLAIRPEEEEEDEEEDDCGKPTSAEEVEEEEEDDHTKTQNTPWQLYFQQDEEGDTQLHIAIIQGFIEVVYSLIGMVPSPHYLDIRNDMRQTGLHLAVLTSQWRIVRRLVCVGARTDIVDRNGNTALHLATAAGDGACVRALTDPITDAEVISAGLRYTPRQRPIHPLEFDVYNYEGLTCVHLSVIGGHIAILRHLCWLGADINAREWKCGRTPLHMAVESGDERLAVMLVREMNAEPAVRNYAGRTAAQNTARVNNATLARALADLGLTHDPDYTSGEDDDDDDDDRDSASDTELQMLEPPFRDIRANGAIVNATA